MFARDFKLIRFAVGAGLAGLVGLGAVACSKPSAINPVDAERVRKIDATVEQIRKAYTGKDPGVFQGLFMPLESLRKMEADIRRDFAVYDQISLDFTIDRVMVEGPDVAVHFHWQGQWQARGEEQPLRERGHAVFRMVGHQNLTLSAVDGDAPFGMSARRVQVERPGGR
ncbi:MAG: hypothetical protein AAB282_02840 [Nitrospirota bacterium]